MEFVQKKFGFGLPYTPESLIVVDAIVDKIRATGATEQQASGLLSGLGCYVGEVLVRHAKASWRWTAEMGMAASCRFPVVVALPGVSGCDAIGAVFQRFSAGPAESVALLYESAVPPRLGDAGSHGRGRARRRALGSHSAGVPDNERAKPTKPVQPGTSQLTRPVGRATRSRPT